MPLVFRRAPWLLIAAAVLWTAPSRADSGGAAMQTAPAAASADTIHAMPQAGAIRPAPFFLPGEREGSWLASDRQLHFAASLAISASLRVEGRSRAEAVVGSLAVGVAKEIYDAALKPRRLGRGASRKDLVADLLGAVAGVALIAAVDR
jgi:uncharacterized protein YfiM (DUF2279 family)